MSSPLSTLLAIRTLTEKGEVNEVERVFQLFLPLLEQVATVETNPLLTLVDALSAHVMSKECKMTPQLKLKMKGECETKAKKYYRAGDLNNIPTDLMKSVMSFLRLKDRIPIECSCRGLFALSRDTPVIHPHLNLQSKMHPDTHVYQPRRLFMSSNVSLPRNIQTKLITDLFVENNDSFQHLLHLDFPVLDKLSIDNYSLKSDPSNLDKYAWEFIRRKSVSSVTIKFPGFTNDVIDFPSLIHEISQSRSIRTLSFTSLRIGQGSPSDSRIHVTDCDLNHLEKLEFCDCEIPSDLFKYFVPQSVVHLGLGGGRCRNVSDPSDRSFMNLPNVQTLVLDYRMISDRERSPKPIIEVIRDYGSTWMHLKKLTVELGWPTVPQLWEFLRVCSELSIEELSLDVGGIDQVDLNDDHDIPHELEGFNKLNKFQFRLMYSVNKDDYLSQSISNVVSMMESHRGGAVSIDIIDGSSGCQRI